MTKEEKLKEAKRLYQTANADQRYVLESLFSELKESEGESMVKFIKNQLFNIKKTVTDNYELDAKLTKAIEWLEKQAQSTVIIIPKDLKGTDTDGGVVGEKGEQCEQKSADRSKFHEGDWITNGDYTWKIVEVKPLDYILQSQDGNIVDDTISHVDEQFHSFTIEDAKDGDVLASKDGDEILIFRNLDSNTSFSFYYNINGKGELGWSNRSFIPATKEQRDILFSKMAEAGFEWDSVNKELRMFEPKFNFKVGQWIVATGKCVYLIAKIDGFNVTLVDTIGNEYVFDVSSLADAHLWTIQDAKDGDVLSTSAGAFIYNGNNGGGSCPGCYCGINTLGNFKTGTEHHWTGKKVYPATKEQRDLLFQKMKGSYEWDAEKNELKKVDQKPTWSAEDERNLEGIIDEIQANKSQAPDYDFETYDRFLSWLKSLKQRIGG